jgi:hypothetical protein
MVVTIHNIKCSEPNLDPFFFFFIILPNPFPMPFAFSKSMTSKMEDFPASRTSMSPMHVQLPEPPVAILILMTFQFTTCPMVLRNLKSRKERLTA